MYGIETKVFNQSVKRNLERFPKDFMFVLKEKEWEILRSQFVTSSNETEKSNWGGTRYKPYVFTEQGIAMLSSILNSKIAIEVNIRIIRVFTKLRQYALTHKEILMQLAKLEKEIVLTNKQTKQNSQDIENIFTVLKELIEKDQNPKPRNRIGYKHYD